MTGAGLAAPLLCAALGLALARAPRRALGPAAGLLLFTAWCMVTLPFPDTWATPVLIGACVGVAACAGALLLPGGVGITTAMALASYAGAFSGALASASGDRLALALALPWVALGFPAAWLFARGWGVAVKVFAGWLVAIALLTAALPLVTTPGYAPDHME